jgi:hypothetical protein
VDVKDLRKLRLARYFGVRARSSSYLTHVSDRHRFVYVEVPKAGCSLVKRALQCSELGGDPERVPRRVHDRTLSPLLRPEDSAASLRLLLTPAGDYFRFTVVRDPFSRILSTYLDKIAGRQAERRRRLPALGVAADAELGFTEFLTLVQRQRVSRMDIHWAPQVALVGHRRIPYDFVGRFERLRNDLLELRTRLDLQFPRSLLEVESGHTTHASDRLSAFYDDTSIRLVREIYREDFVRLGYADRLDGNTGASRRARR